VAFAIASLFIIARYVELILNLKYKIMDEVKVIQVIFCTKKRTGKGVQFDPIRVVKEIFDLDGNLIMDSDSRRIFTIQDLVEFGRLCKKSTQNVETLINRYNQD
jgi:hypothetical protein